ncbi:UNVERIFIED_CONTAM: hypothetical protein NCL1_14632 [Trichonephila clavipes]
MSIRVDYVPYCDDIASQQGPHAWEGAREAIMTSEDRMLWPLTKRKADERRDNIFIILFQRVIKFLGIL